MNNKKLRILALIVSVMMLLAGCSTGGTGEGTPEQAQGNGKVMILSGAKSVLTMLILTAREESR